MIATGKIRKYLGHQFVWVNLLAFVLPIFAKLTPSAIVVFAIMVLLQSKLKLTRQPLSRQVGWFGLIYLFYLIGSLWSQETEGLTSELETKLALIVFPVLFLFTKRLPKKVLHKVLLNFVFGCFVNMLFSVVKGSDCFLQTNAIDCFYSSKLAFGLHPSYLAMYLNLAIAILLYFEINAIRPYKISAYFTWFLLLMFVMFNVFLSSKMGILTLFLILGAFVVFYYGRIGIRKVLVRSIGIGLLLLLATWFSPATLERFRYLSKTVTATAKHEKTFVKEVESNSARVNIWEIVIPLGFENFWFGLGTNDVPSTLVPKYQKAGMEEAAKLRLNCHNQFLETQLAIGIFGLLSVVGLVGTGVYFGIKRRNFVYLVFSLLCFSNFMVESMLETQAGVVFFAFFNCFFFVQLNQLSIHEGNNRSRG